MGRMIARWTLVVLIVLCIVVIFDGLYVMKHGAQLPGMKMLIAGSFFLLIFYSANWLLRN